MVTIDIANQQSQLAFDEARVKDAVRLALEDASLSSARISIAVVDDATIRRLHREYLDQDDPTDVLSFALERSETSLEGEVVVGAETAERTAPQYGWTAEDELLLYVIHGTLHLVGYDDATEDQRTQMRRKERSCLARLGVEGRLEDSTGDNESP